MDWDEKLRNHKERMKKLGIGVSSSTGNLTDSVSSRPPDVVLSTRSSNVITHVRYTDLTSFRPHTPQCFTNDCIWTVF